jgi:hypothetical protein
MQNDEWTVLDVYNSEAEARVVESFLKANGIDAKLIGSLPTEYLKAGGQGLRVSVRNEDSARAIELLRDAQAVEEGAAPPPGHTHKMAAADFKTPAFILVIFVVGYLAFKFYGN